jgi:hypothetical protein
MMSKDSGQKTEATQSNSFGKLKMAKLGNLKVWRQGKSSEFGEFMRCASLWRPTNMIELADVSAFSLCSSIIEQIDKLRMSQVAEMW